MTKTLKDKLIVVGATAVAILIVVLVSFYGGLRMYGSWEDARLYSTKISDGSCNIAVIPVMGTIVPYEGYWPAAEGGEEVETTGEWIVSYLHAAEADPNIAGVLLKLDSYGGAASSAHAAAEALKRSSLPSVALVGEAAASAAYLLATGAGTIIASPFSEIGSIGVTYSYLEQVEKNRAEGLHFVELNSAPYKDTGDPNKPLTEGEIALYERDLKIFHDFFVQVVAKNRDLSAAQVGTLADGSTYPGEYALENGLVDALGDEEAARQWFAQKLQTSPEYVHYCE